MIDLIENIERLHTTELGAIRIKKNLALSDCDVVQWCKNKICLPHAEIERKGKNWYAAIDGCVITVNAYNYCIITAHFKKSDKTHP